MTPLRKHSGKRVFPLADTLVSGFPSVSVAVAAYIKYVQKVSHLQKKSFPVGIFLNSYMKLTFEYFSRLTYMQWRLIHYISHKLKTRAFFHHTNKSLTTSAVVIEVLAGNVNVVFCFFVPVFFFLPLRCFIIAFWKVDCSVVWICL